MTEASPGGTIPNRTSLTRAALFAFVCYHACIGSCCAGDLPPLRCGSQCLYTVMKRFETGPESFEILESELGQPSPDGYSMQQLADVASRHGLQVLGVQTTLENLHERKGVFTCIASLDKNHFVVLADVNDAEATLIDPPNVITVPTSTFKTQWDGMALLVSNIELEPEVDILSRLWWRTLVHRLLMAVGGALAVFVIVIGFRKWQGV